MKITPRRARWVGIAGALLLRALGATWRIRLHGTVPDLQGDRVLAAFLHGDMLIPAIAFRRIPTAVMVSQHGDGELIAQVVQRLGAHLPVRGSATRGGARAFLEMVKAQRALHWAITPDGPRGPRGSVHEGLVMLAIESGRPVRPVGIAVSAGKRFSSWDRFVLPAPLARAVVHFGEPVRIAGDLDRAQRQQCARELERALAAAHEQAVRALAAW